MAIAIVTAAVVIAALVGFAMLERRQPNADSLAQNVLDSMNHSLSSDEDYQKVGLRVTAITVLHVVENMFEGQATAVTRTGIDHEVTVHIVYDGDTMLWRTDPGAFAFTVQEQMQG